MLNLLTGDNDCREASTSPGVSYTEEAPSVQSLFDDTFLSPDHHPISASLPTAPDDAQPCIRSTTPDDTTPPDAETVFSTPVNLKSSSRDPHSVQATTGPDTKKAGRKRYDKEMRPNMVEMEFGTFLDRFIPDNGQPLPTTFAARQKIHTMSKEKLMGLEGEVCHEIVCPRHLCGRVFS